MSFDIDEPCTESWEQMQGDHRARHCGKCKLFVHHLSEMTQREVQALLELAKTERVCVRLCRRDDGSIVTKGAPSYWAAAEQRALRKFGPLSAFALFVVTAAFALCAWLLTDSGGTPNIPPPTRVVLTRPPAPPPKEPPPVMSHRPERVGRVSMGRVMLVPVVKAK